MSETALFQRKYQRLSVRFHTGTAHSGSRLLRAGVLCRRKFFHQEVFLKAPGLLLPSKAGVAGCAVMSVACANSSGRSAKEHADHAFFCKQAFYEIYPAAQAQQRHQIKAAAVRAFQPERRLSEEAHTARHRTGLPPLPHQRCGCRGWGRRCWARAWRAAP